jgi:ClpP class serine protease
MSSQDAFPRGTKLPDQSPLFWVHQKDRYLRQLLISDIEADTQRALAVYFTDTTTAAQIDQNDDIYLGEVLGHVAGRPVDLLLETNGGFTDATEKVVTLVRNLTNDLRVIVPRRAKSNGTVVALAGKEIVMGAQSELGPIDPNLILGGNPVPAHIILKAANVDPLVFQVAELAVRQTKKLATELLKRNMLKSEPEDKIQAVVEKLATRDHYPSHGAVIDHTEAKALGLIVRT